MTPMELSVDLSRNDISFLLLSMRGEDSDRGSRAAGHDTPVLVDIRQDRPERQDPAIREVNRRGQGRSGQDGFDGEHAGCREAGATPKQFANDGGTPLPSAGFLGFDSRSASN